MHRSPDRDFRRSDNTYRRNENRAEISSEAFACPKKHTRFLDFYCVMMWVCAVYTNAGQG